MTDNEVKQFPVLKEAMDEALCGFRNCPAMSNDLEDFRRENAALRGENKKLEQRICLLEQGLAELKERVVERGTG